MTNRKQILITTTDSNGNYRFDNVYSYNATGEEHELCWYPKVNMPFKQDCATIVFNGTDTVKHYDIVLRFDLVNKLVEEVTFG